MCKEMEEHIIAEETKQVSNILHLLNYFHDLYCLTAYYLSTSLLSKGTLLNSHSTYNIET